MSESKIEIKIGQITFSGQGEQDWVAKQLDKILSQAEKLIKLAPARNGDEEGGQAEDNIDDSSITKQTLPAFLKAKNAVSNQNKRFLATAIWLHSKGKKRLITRDVTKALNDASQKRLGNPSDCLGQNVTKGYCERDGVSFFVTDEGRRGL